MAAEGLNSIGAFPVYDTSGNIGLYAKSLATQQAKRAAEQQALQAELSKVKIDGVREPDKSEFYTRYNDWKGTFAKLNGERDSYKRMELQSEFDKKALELNDFIGKSRQYGKDYDDLQKRLLDDNFRDQFEDDSILKVQRANNLPINHPEFITDFTTLGRQVDLSKINQTLEKLDSDLLQQSKWKDKISSGREGNKTGVYVEQYRAVDPSKQALMYANTYDIDPKFRVALKKMYPELEQSVDPTQFKEAAIKQLVQDRKREEWKPRQFNADWKPESNRGSGSRDGSFGMPRDINIPYNNGKANVNAKNFIGLSIPAKNFAGSPAYNMNTGERVGSLASSNDYEVVGVGNFPFIQDNVKDSTGKNLRGTLAQPEYENGKGRGVVRDEAMVHVQQRKSLGGVTITNDFLVPYDRLPENVKSSKPVRQALEQFRPASSQQTQSKPSSYSPAVENGISAVMKANGISREQAIKALKGAGKL